MSGTPKVNLSLQQGATYRRKLVWKDARGRPVDLTGAYAKLQVRLEPGSPVLIELTNASGIDIGNKGVVIVTFTDEETGALDFEGAVYDLLITFSNGETRRLIEGAVTLTKAVTQV